MTTQQNDFKQHLEAAILEEKRIACPNLQCNSIIASKEKVLSPTRSLIEYGCKNEACRFHAKRSFSVTYSSSKKSDYSPEQPNRELSLLASVFSIILLLLMVSLFSSYIFA